MPVVVSRAEALRALDLAPTATRKDIVRAFRRLSLRHHPDRAGQHDQFITILSAKEVLLDHEDGPSGRGSGSDDDGNEWKTPGAVPRAPIRDMGFFRTRYFVPFLDSLFGPCPFRRCRSSVARGNIPFDCECADCRQADLYVPLMADQLLRTTPLHSAHQSRSTNKDLKATRIGTGSGRADVELTSDDPRDFTGYTSESESEESVQYVPSEESRDDDYDLSWLHAPSEDERVICVSDDDDNESNQSVRFVRNPSCTFADASTTHIASFSSTTQVAVLDQSSAEEDLVDLCVPTLSSTSVDNHQFQTTVVDVDMPLIISPTVAACIDVDCIEID